MRVPRQLLKTSQLAQNNLRLPTAAGPGTSAGSAAGPAVSAPAGAENAAGATAGQTSEPNSRWKDPITGDTAAECVNNFRRAAEDAMRKHCQDQREANHKIADGPGGPKSGDAYRKNLLAQAVQAENEAKDPNDKKAQDKARSARRAASRALFAHCRATQGDRIENGTGRLDGEVPRNATPPSGDPVGKDPLTEESI